MITTSRRILLAVAAGLAGVLLAASPASAKPGES